MGETRVDQRRASPQRRGLAQAPAGQRIDLVALGSKGAGQEASDQPGGAGQGDPLPALRSFILPGGTSAAAQLHVARTVVRRAERTAWSAVERYGTEPAAGDSPGGVSPLAITYLNRLSDLLFILARVANTDRTGGDVLWVPGGDRNRSADESEDQA